MRYLSFDLEATGLEQDALIIEFAMVPFDSDTGVIEYELERQYYIQCPSFEELKPKLSSWVIEHNEQLIKTAHSKGLPMEKFRNELENYFEDKQIKDYFGGDKIKLFGKSISAIDLPFLNRDLGWDWMNKYFHHRNLDLSSFCMGLIDMGLLGPGMDSGNKLMQYFDMGDVSHTALEDAINTAKIYLKLLKKFKTKSSSSESTSEQNDSDD